eukprot:1572940-Pleurochrysis_carterae.AAC.2
MWPRFGRKAPWPYLGRRRRSLYDLSAMVFDSNTKCARATGPLNRAESRHSLNCAFLRACKRGRSTAHFSGTAR